MTSNMADSALNYLKDRLSGKTDAKPPGNLQDNSHNLRKAKLLVYEACQRTGVDYLKCVRLLFSVEDKEDIKNEVYSLDDLIKIINIWKDDGYPNHTGLDWNPVCEVKM